MFLNEKFVKFSVTKFKKLAIDFNEFRKQNTYSIYITIS